MDSNEKGYDVYGRENAKSFDIYEMKNAKGIDIYGILLRYLCHRDPLVGSPSFQSFEAA